MSEHHSKTKIEIRSRVRLEDAEDLARYDTPAWRSRPSVSPPTSTSTSRTAHAKRCGATLSRQTVRGDTVAILIEDVAAPGCFTIERGLHD